ncbi:GNAT family N-acetyltransferase [Crystallibacter degradans]|uniref:GNAT family N-acetyltransferase n=1 Tax=Crystallibacter degradans TaxID=2726743 RepID=UPI001473F780|nr:GNAT family N-acetyltransferase [Arthrobacter sp. SF27]NMR29481.1 GNAT family N-acetyltransferase [Arthrobacter sp. SF27]
MSTTSITIHPIRIPGSLESRDAEDFVASSELANLVTGLLWGNNDLWVSPAVRLEGARPNDYEQSLLWAAKDGDRHVGRAVLEMTKQDNLHNAYVHVMIHPGFRRQGIARELLRTAEASAQDHGRRVLQSYSEHPADFDPDGADVLRPRTGTGSLPGNSAAVRFAQSHGYELEQVERFSVLGLPADAAKVASLEAQAAAKAAGYRLLVWEDTCPEEFVDQYALLRQRMSTDVPLGEIDYEEEAWDRARVRQGEEELRRKGGRTLVVAALHLHSGELAGHTFLDCYPEKPDVVYQEDTLVLRTHRGHSLGMLMKAHNLLQVGRLWPEGQRLLTWNAAENEHMLAINDALGFVPAGYEAAWQKRLGARA